MIVEVQVENIALLDRAELTFGPGFTVLTGETGAGKSLLVDAIALALGGRADAELVRAGAARGTVSLVVDLNGRPELLRRCEELGLPVEDGLLYVFREIAVEGRSTARIGGRSVPVGLLRQIGAELVDLHGQHDHQALLDPATHGPTLDAWIGEPALSARAEVGRLYSVLREARSRLEGLRASRRERALRLDLLRHQVEEIRSFGPREGEAEELEQRLARLRNTAALREAAESALAALREGETGVLDTLRRAVASLEAARRLDPEVEPLSEALRAALVQAEEASRGLASYREALDDDPEALALVADRLDGLRRLMRKYGPTEGEILASLERAERELAEAESDEESEEDLARRAERTEMALLEACESLRALRAAKAGEFARLVEAQLRELDMPRAIFEVALRPREPSPSGSDEIEFLFSANPGEPARPLAKIASGGEISRVMLALKGVLAGRAGVPTLVFDEIDAGLGGRAAAVVARKLEELARGYQVIVISHLPQIAARASAHYRIEKGTENGRTATRIRLLGPQERQEEIARMISGEEVSASAREHAAVMLAREVEGPSLFAESSDLRR